MTPTNTVPVSVATAGPRASARRGADVALLAMQTVTVLAIAAIAAFLLAQLAVDRFRRTVSQEIETRYRIVLDEMRSTVEVGSDIGIPIAGIPALKRLTSRLRAGDRDLLFADVMDAEGIVIVSTDSSNLGIPGPAAWTRANERAPGQVWTRADQGGTVLGQAVVSSVGTLLGTVVIGYSSASLRESVDAMRQRAFLVAGSAALFAAAMIFVLVWGGLGSLAAWLGAVESAADGEGDAAPGPLDQDVAAGIDRAQSIQAMLADIVDDAERGDG